MSLAEEVGCHALLSEFLKPADRVLKFYDFVKLRRTNEYDRMEMWNKIEESQKRYEEDLVTTLKSDLAQGVSSRFTLAKLLLAASADANNEDNPIVIGEFSREELDLVEDFERYRVFDILSIEDTVDKIARKESGFYDLIVEYYDKQYSNLDGILESPDILTDLQIAFRDRYLKRQRRIEEVVSVGVKTGRLNMSRMRMDIENAVLDRMKDSEKKGAVDVGGGFGGQFDVRSQTDPGIEIKGENGKRGGCSIVSSTQPKPPMSASPEEIPVTGVNQDITISSESPIKLVVSGVGNDIRVPDGMVIIEIDMSGVDNTVYIPESANPKVKIVGVNNEVVRY